MPDPETVPCIRTKFEALRPLLTERLRRHWAAAAATALGHGGITAVATATGISRATITPGIRELQQVGSDGGEAPLSPGRSRRSGGGCKRRTQTDPTRLAALNAQVEPSPRGDPHSPRRWTGKSTRNLAEPLRRQGHQIGARAVAALRKEQGSSLPANRKTQQGQSHPDRDAPFRSLANRVRSFPRRGPPVVSVDAKTTERVGDSQNGGRKWQPKGSPARVKVPDFADQGLGKAIPSGVADITANQGWVSVGIDPETARFAVAAWRRGWQEMGSPRYPAASELLVTADGGGSNGSRHRLATVALQELADETGLKSTVGHWPPGTSQWNPIEPRLFGQITQTWRGRPLRSLEIIVSLIGSTTTSPGRVVRAELDPRPSETGIEVSDKELAAVRIRRAKFHGEWNYTSSARKRR